jgi:hypothetical protein
MCGSEGQTLLLRKEQTEFKSRSRSRSVKRSVQFESISVKRISTLTSSTETSDI